MLTQLEERDHVSELESDMAEVLELSENLKEMAAISTFYIEYK